MKTLSARVLLSLSRVLRTRRAGALVFLSAVALLSACDEPKKEAPKAEAPEAAPPPPVASTPPAPTPEPAASAPPVKKRTLADCKPHPATVDFGDDSTLEAEVRRKLGKTSGNLTPADLAQIKSINMSSGKAVHQIDPCVFPMFTSLKDLFLGPGDYDDLSPLQKLSNLESLRASQNQVKDLHPIEGLKKMDRLDLSHTQITDESMKSLGSLVNVTELTLDGASVSDLTPIANMKKLERLSIKSTQVKDLAPLAQLKTLKFLYIAETPVSDITPVQPLMKSGTKLVQN
jgi:Leucine-rich repeat (LRR) protein